MAIILEGFSMPDSCDNCPCFNSDYDWRNCADRRLERTPELDNKRMDWCPLKEE